MATPAAEEILARELLTGETIVWSGQPNPSVMFHSEDGLMIPFSLLWGGFALFWFVQVLQLRRDRPTQWVALVWGGVFVLIGQYLIWGRFLYKRWEKRRTRYVLTNRRALILRNGIFGRGRSMAYYEGLPMIDIEVRGDGNGRISFGGPVSGEWRTGKHGPPRPLTFDDVDDADEVFRIVTQLASR